jgi:cytochrome c oxidase cbb3-type subunit I/II
MAMLGVPYADAVSKAEAMARTQAGELAAAIVAQGGPPGLESKKIIALVAYLQRMGQDIKKQTPANPAVKPVAMGATP